MSALPVIAVRPVRRLGPAAVLCHDDNGRPLVAKPLPAECILKGKLHPHVRDRMLRFREAPVLALANLVGMTPVTPDGSADLLWEYLPGQSAEAILPPTATDAQTAPAWLESVRNAVAALHGAGLIHGAIHERNIFIVGNAARLTHASPQLWTDTAADEFAVARLAQLAGVTPSGDDARPHAAPARADSRPQVRWGLAAVAVAVAAAAAIFAWAVARHVN